MLKTCATCSRAFQPRHPKHRHCPTCEPHGREHASPTTRAQDAEYERNRKVILAGDPHCHWCGIRLNSLPPRQRTADHLIAVANGGTNALENLVPACEQCNKRKGARTRQPVGVGRQRQASPPPPASPTGLPPRLA